MGSRYLGSHGSPRVEEHSYGGWPHAQCVLNEAFFLPFLNNVRILRRILRASRQLAARNLMQLIQLDAADPTVVSANDIDSRFKFLHFATR